MRTAIVFGLLVAATPALGAYFDGNALNELCRSDRQKALFYVMGATDQMPGLCAPPNTQYEQAMDVVCNYLQFHPEQRQSVAGELARKAISEAWACS